MGKERIMSEELAGYGGELPESDAAVHARAVLRGEGAKIAARATAWAEQLLQHATEGDRGRFVWCAAELASVARRAQRMGAKLKAGGGQ